VGPRTANRQGSLDHCGNILCGGSVVEHPPIQLRERARCSRVPMSLALMHSLNALVEGFVIGLALGFDVVPPGHAWLDDGHPDSD
jgi:hypothetical protein